MGNQSTDEKKSSYLKYLPAFYSEDEFVGRFLMIFESILAPIEQMVGQIHLYLDPNLMPEEFLSWAASWLDLVLDENWPEDKRRKLVSSAVELYRWRGTSRGLRDYLKIYTGLEPYITEHFGGIRLDKEFKLGHNTVLGGAQRHCFSVTLQSDGDGPIDQKIQEVVQAIIEAEKPAQAGYFLKWASKSEAASAEQANKSVASD